MSGPWDESSTKPEANVNVSLKGEKQTDPWITVEGPVDSVLRTLWRISKDARPHAEEKNLFAAAKAASAEYLKSKPAAPASVAAATDASIKLRAVAWEDVKAERAAPVPPTDSNGDAWGELTDEPFSDEPGWDAITLVESELGGTVVDDDSDEWNLKTPAEKPKAQSWGSAPSVGSSSHSCEHGERVYKEGIGKNGRPYAQWQCPLANWRERCPTEWVND